MTPLYFFNREQFVSINSFVSNQTSVRYRVPQRSLLEPLLFLLYINDLNQAMRFYKFYHFVDDTNLLYCNKSVNRLNKHINLDLKNLIVRLNANKISLNATKTELEFSNIRKKLEFPMKTSLAVKESIIQNLLNILVLKLIRI